MSSTIMHRVLIIYVPYGDESENYIADVNEKEFEHLKECHNTDYDFHSNHESWNYIVHRIGKAFYETKAEWRIEIEGGIDGSEFLSWDTYGIWERGKDLETGGAEYFFIMFE